MKVLQDNHIIHVVLSRKNIESLLYMLDNRDKIRPGILKNGVVVEAEENDEHYDEEPGIMSWEKQ